METPGVRRILVVDDEADFTTTYARLLRRYGYCVIAAGSRHEGLETIHAESVDLVITDLRLPDGDGLDVVRCARMQASPPPVIVVTGFASEASRQAALAAGACGYLSKPFSASAFTALVESTLRPACHPRTLDA